MRSEATFVAAYSVALLILSAGLHRLGRVNTNPWRSRVLAGHRRCAGDQLAGDLPPGAPDSDWPHTEVPRLHTGIALVAAIAAALLSAAELLRHHRVAEAVLLGAVVAIALAGCLRLIRQLHPSQRAEP